jgi:hypothetical protein
VVDKERANFCDWFRMGEAGGSGPSGAEKAKKARDGLAALFGD